MNLYMEFGKNLVLYVLRTQILIIIFFFEWRIFCFCILYNFWDPLWCFWKFFTYFFHDLKLLSFFYIRIHCFFTILLIFFSYGEKVQFFIGKFFRRIIFPVPLKKNYRSSSFYIYNKFVGFCEYTLFTYFTKAHRHIRIVCKAV